MKALAAALVTVAAFACDLASHALELPESQQRGWSFTSTITFGVFLVVLAEEIAWRRKS